SVLVEGRRERIYRQSFAPDAISPSDVLERVGDVRGQPRVEPTGGVLDAATGAPAHEVLPDGDAFFVEVVPADGKASALVAAGDGELVVLDRSVTGDEIRVVGVDPAAHAFQLTGSKGDEIPLLAVEL